MSGHRALPQSSFGLLLLVLVPYAGTCGAAEFGGRGEFEGRWFPHVASPQTDLSGAATATLTQDFDDGAQSLRVEAFGRVDEQDGRRTHADLREAYWQWLGDSLVLTAGVRRVFWGYTESRHLVDVVNQTDFVEDIEAEQKLGQPMLSASWIGDSQSLELMGLPLFRERRFPGVDGQPRIPVSVAEREAEFSRHRDLAYALRYRIGFEGLDIGLSWFEGSAREPGLSLCLERGSQFSATPDQLDCSRSQALLAGSSPDRGALGNLLRDLGLAPSDAALRRQVIEDLVLAPRYDRLRQLSVDALQVIGPWALKLEALARERSGQRTYASVAGVEYTIGNVLGSGAALGLVAEWLDDERSDVLSARFDHEWFGGLRLALLDRRNTQALLGLLGDRRGGDRLLQLEFSFKPAKRWRVLGKFRSFDKVPGDELTGFLRDEDLLSLTLERYF